MSRRILLMTLLGIVPVALVATFSRHKAPACGPYSADAAQTVYDLDLSQQGVEALRAQGPAGLEQVLKVRDAMAEQLAATEDSTEWAEINSQLERIDDVVDQVGGQLHCSVSRLYWYTDIESAQEAARTSGKPILSLRLLGQLTDECSCANSRFFRTALYSNTQIATLLRDNFVLHWETVRPVPVITIDFGDGRLVRRTITGNSAHYLLDAEGRPLDVLPGLYGPAAFQGWLDRSLTLADGWNNLNQDGGDSTEAQREQFLAIYHRQQLRNLTRAFTADLVAARNLVWSEADVTEASESTEVAPLPENASTPPTALEAAPIAHGKFVLEAALLLATAPTSTPVITDENLSNIDEFTWAKIAALHAGEAQLDEASIALMRQENPTATQAGLRAVTKSYVEDPLVRLVQNFQTSMAIDTVRNEYLLHRQIHDWFAKGSAPQDRQALNERIYSQLFLTPSSDPWLGLIPANTYSALPENGLVFEDGWLGE